MTLDLNQIGYSQGIIGGSNVLDNSTSLQFGSGGWLYVVASADTA
jgi:hypothetical protein